MKHKHYDMIVAKAANMDLVVFFKATFSSEWGEVSNDLLPAFHPETDYFLCLPQHKEGCLHWLNGGGVQHLDKGSHVDMTSMNDLKSRVGKIWSYECAWMDDDCEIRIKPKKEKRLIAIHPETSDIFVATSAYIAHDGFQLIEIEVEV